MGEDDICKYLSSQSASRPPAAPRVRVRRPVAPPPEAEGFADFNATHLFCPRCRQAMPVRSRLMLVLPDGDLHDYQCEKCGTSTGTRRAGR